MDECIWESRCCLIDLLFLSHCLFSEIKAKDHLLKIGALPVAIEISNASLWDWERLHRISKVRLASEKWAILVYWKSWSLWFMMTSHFASFPGPNSKGEKSKIKWTFSLLLIYSHFGILMENQSIYFLSAVKTSWMIFLG